jgi:hypothetical protein
MNRAFNRLVNVLTNVALDDTQCGFKAFRAPVAKLLFHCSVTERFAFDVEILSLARRFGLVIAEVPVQWLRVQGSQIRPWSDARSMAGDVFRAGRRGAHSGKSVPTLSVKLPDGSPAAEASSATLSLPPGLPVLHGNDGLLVLCPMLSDAGVEEAAASVVARCPGAAVERSALTVAQLCQMAPLSMAWDGDTTAPATAIPPAH